MKSRLPQIPLPVFCITVTLLAGATIYLMEQIFIDYPKHFWICSISYGVMVIVSVVMVAIGDKTDKQMELKEPIKEKVIAPSLCEQEIY